MEIAIHNQSLLRLTDAQSLLSG